MRTLILMASLFFSLGISAQKDAKAKTILDRSSETYANSGDMTVSFTMSVKDVNSSMTSFDGEIRIKNEKFHFSTPDAETWFDGKTQWALMKQYKEVNVSEPSGSDIQAINPSAIFNIYKKGCDYKLNGEKTDIKNRRVYEVELIPQGKSEMTRIVLQINKADQIPVFFHIYYKNKFENLIFINKYTTKLNHPENLFVFDKSQHPDAEIIDLR